MHNIPLRALRRELNNIEHSFTTINFTHDNPYQTHLFQIHLRNTQSKLDHLYHIPRRSKRGIINGLGSAISWLTGNMDADDKARYDDILRKVEANEYHLEHNVAQELSVNKRLVQEFNKDIKIIQLNNQRIRTYFSSLSNTSDLIAVNQQYSLLFNALTLLYTKISNLETSLEFCKLNVLHSSILSYTELEEIILTSHVPLISNNPAVLWTLASVHCSLHGEYISYFIKFPTQSLPYETFFLLSYPVHNDALTTTIPVSPSLVLRYNELLTGKCDLIANNYYCKNVSTVVNNCIKELLAGRTLSNCNALVLSNVNPFIKYVPIIDQYLLFNISQCTIIMPYKNITLYPKLTQLLSLNDSEQLFNFPKSYVHWETDVIVTSDIAAKLYPSNFSFDEIHEANVNINHLEELEYISDNDYSVPIIICAILFFLVCFFLAYQCHIATRCRAVICRTRSETEDPALETGQPPIYPRLAI